MQNAHGFHGKVWVGLIATLAAVTLARRSLLALFASLVPARACRSSHVLRGCSDSRGSRSVFGAKWFFGGLRCKDQKTRHLQESSVCLALPPQAAGPNNHYVPENVWFVALVPQASKNPWQQKNFGSPLSNVGNVTRLLSGGMGGQAVQAISRRGEAAKVLPQVRPTGPRRQVYKNRQMGYTHW